MMAVLGRQTPRILGILLGISLVGCHGDSSSCPAGNGKACDIFSYPVKLKQDEPRLHFSDLRVIEGACEPPRCVTTACTDLIFPGLYYQLEVTSSTSVVSPPDTRCRFQISSAEGESFDVVLSLADSSSSSFCCNTGLRKFIGYSWSAFVNGVELQSDVGGYHLPQPLDGGVALSGDAGPLPAEVTPADSGPHAADGARDADDESACVALASVSDQCPADWGATIADQIAFCAQEAPFFDTFLSTGSCRGGLHYTKHLFDAGPRFCVYDPATLELVGYRAVDGKAGFEQTSCGSNQADFDDQGCAGMTCAMPDASVAGSD
jgi:hypothetical protein